MTESRLMIESALIVSTEPEAELLLKALAGLRRIEVQSKAFYLGRLNGNDFAVCICGVGKANAAQATAVLIERFSPQFVFNIGVGGALPSSGLKVGDIVVAEREIYADEGVSFIDSFGTMEAIGLPLASVNARDYYNELPMSIPDKWENASKGAFVTVSSCTGSLQRGKELESRFQALCENMEGAAIAHICLLNGVRAAEARGISNIIEDRTPGPLNRDDIITACKKAQEFFLERV